MKIILRTPQSTQELTFDELPTISQIRLCTAEKFEAPVDQVCLITKGKIMKDIDSSSDFNIQDGSTIHVVILKQKEKTTTTSQPTFTPAPPQPQSFSQESQQSSPFSFGLPGSQNILNDPSVVSHLLENPAIQNLMSDPVFMETVINSHPTLKTLCENNPEVMRIFQDPSTSKMLIEMMKNPNMYNEMLRNQDRVLAQLENIPGGYNQLSGLMGQLNSFDTPNPYAVQRGADNSSTSSTASTNVTGEPLPSFDQRGSNFSTPSYPTANPGSLNDNAALTETIERMFRSANNSIGHSTSGGSNLQPSIQLRSGSSEVPSAVTEELQKMQPTTRQALLQLVNAAGIVKTQSPHLYDFLELSPNLPTSVVLVPVKNVPIKPEEDYTEQLKQLNEMGFYDRDVCIQALTICSGDVTRAVDWILSRNR